MIWRLACFVLALVTVVIMAVAWYTQYVWGWDPCALCSLQRIPYIIAPVVLLGAAGLWHRDPRAVRLLLALAMMAFAFGIATALYHVGAEQGWWRANISCASPLNWDRQTGTTGFIDLLQNQNVVSCSKSTVFVWGMSMAFTNVLVSVFLFTASAFVFHKRTHQQG